MARENKFRDQNNKYKNALKCEARAREGTKPFFISLRKVKN